MRATEFAYALLGSWFEIGAIGHQTELIIMRVLHDGPCPCLWTHEQYQLMTFIIAHNGERYLPVAIFQALDGLCRWTTLWFWLWFWFLGSLCSAS